MLVDLIQVEISVETRHDFPVGPAQSGIEPILKPHLISRSVLFGGFGHGSIEKTNRRSGIRTYGPLVERSQNYQ